jgi:2-phosphoglycerate kinase
MALFLIGGPPKCGKTTLAKALSKQLSIPWISADTLQNIVWAYTPKEKHATLFPHSYLRGDSNDEFYAAHDVQQIIQGYIAQGKATDEAISMMAETYLIDKDDFIVEGYQVTPELVNRILEKFGTEHIKAVFLVRHNEQKFVQDVHKSTTPNDWILRKTKNEETFLKIAQMVDEYSQYFEQEARKYDLPVFQMDTDFDAKIKEIIEFLS